MPPSSRGLGHLPFTEATGIRIPLGVLMIKQKNTPVNRVRYYRGILIIEAINAAKLLNILAVCNPREQLGETN
jgi:hypothetical protein